MAIEPGDAKYKCLLDPEGKKKARDELNEIESDRATAVQTLRKWVIEQKDWLKSPTDFDFLLRFLRVRKFSQVGAKLSLENYLSNFTKVPEWFTDVDPADPKLQAILRTGFMFSPMKLDKDNRRIIIEREGMIDIPAVKKQYGFENVFKAISLVTNWITTDENAQVHGIKLIFDCTNLTMQHATTMFGPENASKLLNYYENSIPVRMKGLNFYKEPPFFDAIFSLVSPFMKEKSKKRMILHGKSMTRVYDVIDKSVLPKEYLPDDYTGPCAGSTEQIIEDMISDMMRPDFRNYMKDISSSKYGVDLSMKPCEKEPVGTFRKLTLD